MSLSSTLWTRASKPASAGFYARWLAWRLERGRRSALRRTYRLLLKVGDDLLDDIGLDRSYIEKAARLPLSVDAGTVLRQADHRKWTPTCATSLRNSAR